MILKDMPRPALFRTALIVSLILLTGVSVCYASIVHNFFVAEDLVTVWALTPQSVAKTFFPGGGLYRPLTYVLWFGVDVL